MYSLHKLKGTLLKELKEHIKDRVFFGEISFENRLIHPNNKEKSK